MAEIKAHLNNLRTAPRKVRLAANLIKGMSLRQARLELKFLPKHYAHTLAKLLESVVANAKHNFQLSEDGLYIKEVFVNQGNTLRRQMPRAFGRASPIRKKASRVSIILETREEGHGKKKKKLSQPSPILRDMRAEDIGEDFEAKKEGKPTIGASFNKLKAKPVNFVRRIFTRKAI